MRRMGLVALLALGMLASCDANSLPRTQYFFSGFVYDGLTGAPITDYELTLYWDAHTMRARVDASGRYFVGPMDAEHDHQVEIVSDGYRLLRSSNDDLGEDGPDEVDGRFQNNRQTLIRDAFLWPIGASSEAGRINVFFNDSTDRPADGFVRLRPDGTSDFLDGDTPQGEWSDDAEDIAPSVVLPIENGVADIPAETLILGVTYDILVYGVTGYEYDDEDESFDAGQDSVVDVFLSPLDDEDLEVVDVDDSPTEQGGPYEVVYIFNRDIELCTLDNTREWQEERIDDDFDFDVDDLFDEGTGTEIVHNDPASDDEDDVQENGTSIAISGTTLTIAWDGSVFEGPDAENDVITDVNFNSLCQIDIQPVNEPDDCDRLCDFGDSDSEKSIEVSLE